MENQQDPVRLRVYDAEDNERDLAWAREKYGVGLEIYQGKGWHVSRIQERVGAAASVEMYLYHRSGAPAADWPIGFHWPGGSDPKTTDDTGKVGWAYGPGAWITDPSVGGPHWVEIGGDYPADNLSRLGMLAGTNHDHLDFEWAYGPMEEEPPVNPEEVIVKLAEELLEAVPVPSDWALPAAAGAQGYSWQVGGYGRVEIKEKIWVYQTFTNIDQSVYVVAFCADGDWANVQIAEVIRG